MTTQHERYPSARIYVVAHSHGGNVALRAVKGAVRQSCKAVVCLSTPFLDLRQRTGGSIEPRPIWAIAALLVVFAVAMYRFLWLGAGFGLVLGTVLTMTVYTLRLLLTLERRIRNRKAALRRIVQSLELPNLDGLPILVVRSPVDEAFLPLASAQFLTAIMTWLSLKIDRLAARLKATIGHRYTMAGLVLYLAFVAIVARLAPHVLGSWYSSCRTCSLLGRWQQWSVFG